MQFLTCTQTDNGAYTCTMTYKYVCIFMAIIDDHYLQSEQIYKQQPSFCLLCFTLVERKPTCNQQLAEASSNFKHCHFINQCIGTFLSGITQIGVRLQSVCIGNFTLVSN